MLPFIATGNGVTGPADDICMRVECPVFFSSAHGGVMVELPIEGISLRHAAKQGRARGAPANLDAVGTPCI
jgi:hypothetical protein